MQKYEKKVQGAGFKVLGFRYQVETVLKSVSKEKIINFEKFFDT